MVQNNILGILEEHQLIPVVTIYELNEIDGIIKSLLKKEIHVIEVTLRTSVAFEAIEYIKKHYSKDITVGVGTVVTKEQILKIKEIGADFIVSPGINKDLAESLEKSGVAFIPGVATPSDIILGLQLGWNVFKFFPANLFGEILALQTYNQVFPNVIFCPTGGINEDTFSDYLKLSNVISVGGSWMLK
jgi:2-dehydro-3-deoxyphosphogluconate aldolase/(4S)-4-hydroxy-2-oxoglutarate aldolase